MLHIKLIGQFEVRLDQDVSIPALGRKAVSLLCLLALSEKMKVTRDKAAGLIWSDRSEEQARASLRQELSQLRNLLGGEAIAADRQSIWLEPAAVSIDVQNFRLKAVVDRRESLEEAAHLYVGPLLDGHHSKSDGFEEWIAVARSSLENEAIGTMIRLAQNYLKNGQAKQAFSWAERAIGIDPLRESSHCVAIEAMAVSGDRPAALVKLQELEMLLDSELGVSPSKRTLDLLQRLNATEITTLVEEVKDNKETPSVLADLFSDRAAVAVMPFRCLSKADDDIFFTDAITEDVVNGLALWRWFPVIGRNTTNRYRDVPGAMEIISEKTNARYVIDGSVRRSGSRFRVTVELCDTASGQQLWSERFDGMSDDVLQIQDEISDNIARRVEPEIIRAERDRLYRQKPSDLSDWELLHKARITKYQSGHNYGTVEDNKTAMAMFRAVASRDPYSSDAINGIATCHWHDALNGWSSDPARSGDSAMRRAREAYELDRTNYQALGNISITQTFAQHDTHTAEITARKSLDVNPSDIIVRHYLVCSLEFGGKFNEAIEHCEYMIALDPYAPSLSVLCGDMSTCLLLSGDPQQAVEYSRKSMEADPGYSRGRQRLIAALVAAGEIEEAKKELAILQLAMPGFNLEYVHRTYPFAEEKHLNQYTQHFSEIGVN
jgi:DNA-binding SARP family transcriptional activator/Flp pilus assembly protein TadD